MLLRGILLLLVLWTSSSAAVIETYDFSSPELEVRYKLLSQELRCPKCQNQNIADSNAPISRDLRAILYEQLESGASNVNSKMGGFGNIESSLKILIWTSVNVMSLLSRLQLNLLN